MWHCCHPWHSIRCSSHRAPIINKYFCLWYLKFLLHTRMHTSYSRYMIKLAVSLPSFGFSRYKLEDHFSWRPSVPFFLPNVASKPFHRLRSLLLPPLWAIEHVYHANKLDLILLGATSEFVYCIFQFRWALPYTERHSMRSKLYWRYARTYK